MITFNELRITPNNRKLIIEVQVEDDPLFANVNISSINIVNQNHYKDGGPSIEHSFVYTPKEATKKVRLELDDKALNIPGTEKFNLAKDILFVYVITEGAPSPDTPCGMDSNITMRSVVNLYPLYKRTLYHVNELSASCSIPRSFINDILLFKAFELCIRTKDYNKAIELWNKYLSNMNNSKFVNCLCNGTCNNNS